MFPIVATRTLSDTCAWNSIYNSVDRISRRPSILQIFKQGIRSTSSKSLHALSPSGSSPSPTSGYLWHSPTRQPSRKQKVKITLWSDIYWYIGEIMDYGDEHKNKESYEYNGLRGNIGASSTVILNYYFRYSQFLLWKKKSMDDPGDYFESFLVHGLGAHVNSKPQL
jgi:hypothetical protein